MIHFETNYLYVVEREYMNMHRVPPPPPPTPIIEATYARDCALYSRS